LKTWNKQFEFARDNDHWIATVGDERHCSGEKAMSKILRSLWLEDDGQDVPEYALVLALLLVIVISVVGGIGSYSNTIFGQVRDAMSTAAAAA